MSGRRCPGCEEVMTEIECYECVTIARAAESKNSMERNWFKRKTHCIRGHAFTPQNTRIDHKKNAPHGYQACRQCHKEYCARRRERLAAEREKTDA